MLRPTLAASSSTNPGNWYGWVPPRPAAVCAPGEVCAVPRVRRSYRLLFVAVAMLVAVALVFPWAAPWFY